MAQHGLTSMIFPEIRVDMFVKTTLANFGGLVIHDGVYFKLQQLMEYSLQEMLLPIAPVANASPMISAANPIVGPIVLWARRITDGEILWVRVLEQNDANTGGLTGYGSCLFVGTSSRTVHIVDMATGKDRASLSTRGHGGSAPIVNNRAFFLAGSGGFAQTVFSSFVEILTVGRE